MKTFQWPLLRSMLDLGSGDFLGRICGIATVLVLAHRCGVVVVGVYALAQTMLQYSQPVIDFGMRHVGARLVAQCPQAAREIVLRVQRRRFAMASALFPVLLVYAAFAKLPWGLKGWLAAVAAICTLHALSLDWVAWGKGHMRLVGFGRSSVSVLMLISVVLARNSEQVLWWLACGIFGGSLVQGAIFWSWWWRHQPVDKQSVAPPAISESLAWQRTSILGLATLCNLVFNSIDMLMLGVMSNPREVGLYSASYRVVNQVLYTYYLLTQVLYPQLARQDVQERIRMLSPRVLLALAGAGTAIAAVLAVTRRPVLNLLFGAQFLPATLLLLLLAWAIPLDFLTSYLNNAYLAWGMEKKLLLCTMISAASNVMLNLIWIPAYGATAAAVNTLISYVIFLASLALAGRSARELNAGTEPLPELIA